MKIEVLSATMYQKDLSKYKKMNLQSDVVFANQDDRHEYIEEIINGNLVKMITTPFRGVGKNRNEAILYSSGDILMFSDDDMIYNDGYENGVLEAFEKLPDADMIIFHCSTSSRRGTPEINKISRVRLWNFMRYGTVGFVIKKESLLKSNVSFSLLFGGGARYCGGEDNLFLREMLREKIKVYSYPYTIAKVNNDESTWFQGYNEKHFFDNGALLATCFPVMKHLLIWYFVFKYTKDTKVSKYDIIKLQRAGIDCFTKGMSYDDWKNS